MDTHSYSFAVIAMTVLLNPRAQILCECTNKGLDGNFSTVSKQILEQITIDTTQRNNKKLTFVFEGYRPHTIRRATSLISRLVRCDATRF